MKYLKFKLFAFFLTLTVISSCGVDDGDCYSDGYVYASTVTGPTTAVVDEEITLNVSFKIYSSCGAFTGFDQSLPKNVHIKVRYTGCQCTNTNTTVTEPYVFSADEPGEYELKFLKEDNTYITRTITVTEAD